MRGIKVVLAFLLLAAGAFFWFSRELPKSPDEIEPKPPSAAPFVEEGLQLENKFPADEVFRRALWRHPAPEDRILHAERRHWLAEDGLAQWQWFLVFQPAPETLHWLKTNPFALATEPAGEVVFSTPNLPPPWFPKKILAGQAWRNASGTHRIAIEEGSGKVFASDQGSGHASPAPTVEKL
jgi:hypothetical protein